MHGPRHVHERRSLVSGSERGDAIRRNPELELSDMSILRRCEDADISGDTRNNQAGDAQVLQKEFERRSVECRMPGFQDRKIAFGGFENFRNLLWDATPGTQLLHQR